MTRARTGFWWTLRRWWASLTSWLARRRANRAATPMRSPRPMRSNRWPWCTDCRHHHPVGSDCR